MAINIYDLTNAARKIQENLDKRAQEQGEQFAQRLINSRGSKRFFTIALSIIFSGVAFSLAEPFLYAIAAIVAALTGGFVSFGTSQVVVGIVFLYLCYALAVRIVGKQLVWSQIICWVEVPTQSVTQIEEVRLRAFHST